LDREIKYVATTLDQYRQELESDGLQPFLIQHLLEVAKDYQHGGEDFIIGEVTGRPPMTVTQGAIQQIKPFSGCGN
jgi:hypothetical protein